MQKGMSRLDHWEHFLTVTTEILEQIIRQPVKSSSLVFRSKPVKQRKELSHCNRFFAVSKKKNLQVCYRCIVYGFY